jgi:hypothetical protein
VAEDYCVRMWTRLIDSIILKLFVHDLGSALRKTAARPWQRNPQYCHEVFHTQVFSSLHHGRNVTQQSNNVSSRKFLLPCYFLYTLFSTK